MPRLSVDIDLTYLPFDTRAISLNNISGALFRIKQNIKSDIPDIHVEPSLQTNGRTSKLICRHLRVQVKIEVNTTIRGHILPPRLMQIADAVQDEFKMFAAIQVVSHAELFGGKICAALDRQHPRDLFDIYHLFKKEGFSDEVRLGFIVALVSHNRPMHEIIRPNFLDKSDVFNGQFAGMTRLTFTYQDYDNTRKQLVKQIHAHLTEDERKFLLGFKAGRPDWHLLPLRNLSAMPAVKWKLMNIQELIEQAPDKHAEQLKKLEESL